MTGKGGMCPFYITRVAVWDEVATDGWVARDVGLTGHLNPRRPPHTVLEEVRIGSMHCCEAFGRTTVKSV